MKKIAIIGGGPAGIMAAIGASRSGGQVSLFEKNEKLGKKLYITGKGRCNISNAKSMSQIMSHVKTNPRFLHSAFSSLTNQDMLDLLASVGLKTKVERGDRIFPVSDKSSDVIKAFEKLLQKELIDLRLNSKIKSIKYEADKFILLTNDVEMTFDALILATGGMSYPATGSDGDGYIFAKKLGHNIISPKPSLVGILLDDDFINQLNGVSLKNINLEFNIAKKKYRYFGELVFTRKGISGPIVLQASADINKSQSDVKNLCLDLKASLNEEQLDARLLRDIKSNSNKYISNILELITIRAMIEPILTQANVDPKTLGHQITKKERLSLIRTLKNFQLTYNGLDDIKYAIVTSGGVSTKEINPSTLESKLIDHLYFAGELIDVDALTGGYNLQIAYSTGYLAGISAAGGIND